MCDEQSKIFANMQTSEYLLTPEPLEDNETQDFIYFSSRNIKQDCDQNQENHNFYNLNSHDDMTNISPQSFYNSPLSLSASSVPSFNSSGFGTMSSFSETSSSFLENFCPSTNIYSSVEDNCALFNNLSQFQSSNSNHQQSWNSLITDENNNPKVDFRISPQQTFTPRSSKVPKFESRPFVCTYENCNRSYTKRGHLLAHERCHDGVRTFICDQLIPLSVDSQGKSEDVAIHMGSPPVGFKYCGVAFLRCDQLTRHRREHLQIKPFRCPYCERSFNRSDHRLVHIRRHDDKDRASPLKEKQLLIKNTFLPKRVRTKKPLSLTNITAINVPPFTQNDPNSYVSFTNFKTPNPKQPLKLTNVPAVSTPICSHDYSNPNNFSNFGNFKMDPSSPDKNKFSDRTNVSAFNTQSFFNDNLNLKNQPQIREFPDANLRFRI